MVFDCIQRKTTQSRLRTLALITSFVSFALSLISTTRCTFILSGATTSPDDQMYAWGLFSTPVYDNEEGRHDIQGCIAYPSSIHLGSAIKTSQAFSVLLVIFTFCIVVGLLLVGFFLEYGAKTVYHIIKVLLPCTFCCQLLTFASFASKFCTEIIDEQDENKGTVPATCIPGGAGVCAIFNLVAIIILTIVMKMTRPPEHPIFQLYGTGNNVMRVVNPNSNNGPRKKNHYNNFNAKRKSKGRKNKKYSSNSNNYITDHHHHHHHGDRQERRGKEGGGRRVVEQFTMMEPQRPGKDKIKTTIVNGPDVRKTIKEITHPDGSQTITTTVEELQPYNDIEDLREEEEDYIEDDDITEEVDCYDGSLDDDSTILEVL